MEARGVWPGLDPVLRAEIVHSSERTRITRLFRPGRTVIRKELLGPDAERRVRHDAAVLDRLRGVAGVAQLAEGPRYLESVMLEDAGGTSLTGMTTPFLVHDRLHLHRPGRVPARRPREPPSSPQPPGHTGRAALRRRRRSLPVFRAPDLSDGPVDGVEISDVVVGDVAVRLYRPAGGGDLPLHIYFHGGGFVLGSALSGDLDGLLARRARDAGYLVASVEYRLAPEHRFPAGVDDCYTALTGLAAEPRRYGIAPEAITVGGASSGGNFAAVIALMTRDLGGPALALQLLEIAGTDLTKSSAAWRNPRPEHDSTREMDLVMVDLYLSSLAERAHPYASPLFAPNLEGLARPHT